MSPVVVDAGPSAGGAAAGGVGVAATGGAGVGGGAAAGGVGTALGAAVATGAGGFAAVSTGVGATFVIVRARPCATSITATTAADARKPTPARSAQAVPRLALASFVNVGTRRGSVSSPFSVPGSYGG